MPKTISMSPCRRFLSVVSGNMAKIWDTGTCHLIKNLVHGDHMSIRYSCVAWPTMSTQAARHLADNPAPLYLAAATYDGAVFVWSTGSDQLVALLSRTKTSRNSEQRVHSKFAAIEDVCMNQQQSLVYTAMRGDRFVLEWGVQSGKVLRQLDTRGKYGVSRLCLSPDNAQLLTVSTHMKLWDVASRALVTKCPAHTTDVTCTAFSACGSYFVSCGEDRYVSVWTCRPTGNHYNKKKKKKKTKKSSATSGRCLAHVAMPAVALSVSALCMGESVLVAVVTRQGTAVLVKAEQRCEVEPAPGNRCVVHVDDGKGKAMSPIGDVLGVSMLQPSPLRLKLVRGSVARPFFQNVIVPHTAETPYSLPPTLALQRATPLELVLTAHEGKPPGSRGTGPRKRGRVGDAVKVAGVRDFQTSNATRKRPNPSSNGAGRDDNKRLRNLILLCDKRLNSTTKHSTDGSTRGRKDSKTEKVDRPDPQPVTIAKVLTEELQIWHSHATRITCKTRKGLGSVDDNVLAVCMSLDTRDKVVRQVLKRLRSPVALLLLRRLVSELITTKGTSRETVRFRTEVSAAQLSAVLGWLLALLQQRSQALSGACNLGLELDPLMKVTNGCVKMHPSLCGTLGRLNMLLTTM